MSKKEEFLNLMENIFVGNEIEGKSGYVNLMRVRSKFYKEVVKKIVSKFIEEFNKKASKLFPGETGMEEALFDNLYTFYSKYLNGYAVYYNNINPSNPTVIKPYQRQTLTGINIENKQYEDFTTTNDVALFWKTKDLYYVKTDKIYQDMDIKVDDTDYIIHFDVSELEHKSGNEKIKLIYEYAGRKNNKIFLKVLKSTHNKKTKLKDIAEAIGVNEIGEEQLKKIIAKFEMQSEIDYFIHKNAREFLDNELRFFIADNLSSGSPMADILDSKGMFIWQWTRRIGRVINYLIGVFEDELVKIWNKPRFVKNSHYVITLDRIWNKGGKGKKIVKEVVKYLKEQEGQFREEVAKIGTLDKKMKERYEKALNIGYSTLLTDWYVLGIIDANFDVNNVLEVKTGKGMLEEKTEELNPKWQFLPVDTKFLPEELEYKILSLFDNLDDALDGWLIHSENYQALNTILPKWREKVQTIYIDPPFNTGKDFDYVDGYQDSTWLTLMDNRLRLAKNLLDNIGSIFVHVDYNANFLMRFVLNDILHEENLVNEIIWSYPPGSAPKKGFGRKHDTIFFFSKGLNYLFNGNLIREPYDVKTIERLKYKGSREKNIEKVLHRGGKIPTDVWNLSHVQGNSEEFIGFFTQKAEKLILRMLLATSNPGDLILDFFLGSGTTTAVAHKIRRKWIGIEMGEHFYTVDLPRMKKVLFYDKSGISKDKDVKEHYNKDKAGGFFKYYELEQFPEILERMKYNEKIAVPKTDIERFFEIDLNGDPQLLKEQHIFQYQDHLTNYVRLTDNGITFKMCDTKVNPNCKDKIDYAETISNLLGLSIRRIEKDKFILNDGTKNGLIIPIPIPAKLYQRLKLNRLVDWE